MKKRKMVCVLAAVLLLAGCGKTEKEAASASAEDTAQASADAADGDVVSQESAAEPAPENADSSSVTDSTSDYKIKSHGSREYNGAAANDDFADALFIGDSRTVGLMLNGDKPKADYFATAGLNVMTAQSTPVVPKRDFEGLIVQQAYTDYGWGDNAWDDTTWDDTTWDDGGWTGGDSTEWDWGYSEPDSSEETSSVDEDLMTIPEALALKQYKRIFINFGVNELGWPYPDVFVERYKLLILQVRAAQPDAQIYIESMLPVSPLALSIDKCYTTENVDNFNENYVRRAAQETNCTYLDVNQFFRDADGGLFADASTDGIHLNRDYCMEWMDILSYYTVGGGDISILSRRHETESAPDGSIEPYSDGGDGYSEDGGTDWTDGGDNGWGGDGYSDWNDEGGYGDYNYGYEDYTYDNEYDYDYGY
ncbi:GDSL-like Lipase/Acylhydrolase family protein [Ruminococcus sp. YE71]|uniref:GDSL-type esterase/lipase family protein n=1 Tax=unclassified Ruminococcus TaxID=2608920 RepID=UPI00088FE063|nr:MULTISPECIES: GDSL-type esterase/lipase family protein [unclassified Ruminococcus]SDA16263.1 GDSL-like Lipase/Acylhydrolase family protein [Ruminococcus sp. YE78]SFW24372.1 GDSL-like Lipase/Acylhydrolase family protein [Ruminococcus sp. YE71]